MQPIVLYPPCSVKGLTDVLFKVHQSFRVSRHKCSSFFSAQLHSLSFIFWVFHFIFRYVYIKWMRWPFASMELVSSARICVVSRRQMSRCCPADPVTFASKRRSAPSCNHASSAEESGKTVFPGAALLKCCSGVKTLDVKPDVQPNHNYQIALRYPRYSVPPRTWREGLPSALKRFLQSLRGSSCNLKPSCTAVFGEHPLFSFKHLWGAAVNGSILFFLF